jgi:glyoxylase I family protein
MIRWSHVALNCADLRATERFYADLFGFERARVVPSEDGDVIFLRHGDAYLELFDTAGENPAARPEQDGPHSPAALRHIAFQVDDVDAFLAGAGDRAEVTLGPLDFGEVIPNWRTVWVRDPDGVVVEVSQGYRDQNEQKEKP